MGIIELVTSVRGHVNLTHTFFTSQKLIVAFKLLKKTGGELRDIPGGKASLTL